MGGAKSPSLFHNEKDGVIMDNSFFENLQKRIASLEDGISKSQEVQAKLQMLLDRERESFLRMKGALSELKDMAENSGHETTSNADDRNSEEGNASD